MEKREFLTCAWGQLTPDCRLWPAQTFLGTSHHLVDELLWNRLLFVIQFISCHHWLAVSSFCKSRIVLECLLSPILSNVKCKASLAFFFCKFTWVYPTQLHCTAHLLSSCLQIRRWPCLSGVIFSVFNMQTSLKDTKMKSMCSFSLYFLNVPTPKRAKNLGPPRQTGILPSCTMRLKLPVNHVCDVHSGKYPPQELRRPKLWLG